MQVKPIALAIALAYSFASASHAADAPQTSPDVVVRGAQERATPAPAQLRDEILKTESITARAIEKTNASNLTEALDNRPGIAVQVECSVCNVRNITLNNLPGRFTTLLIDGVPLHSSVSTAYGLDSVPIFGVERIDITRGAGASLIAPEALAGTVNIVTKRPTRAESVLNGQLGSFGSWRGDAYLARPLTGGAVALSVDHRRHDTMDADGSGVSQYAGFDRTLAGLAWFADDVAGFKLRGRIDAAHEDRNGGALGRDTGAIEESSRGNPFDFRRLKNGSPTRDGWVIPSSGGLAPYDEGRAGLSQIVTTRRDQAYLIGERGLANSRLRLVAGVARHHQDSFYGGDARYGATQNQYYLESSVQTPWAGNLFTLGANWRFEDLESTGFSFETQQRNDGLDNYSYRTPGVFVQWYRALLDNRLELNGSLRVDQHNVFGTITSPRVNALYQHTPAYSSRVSVGRGYRAPTSFFEQEHGMLADARIVRAIDKPEVSDNASYALSFASDRFSFVGSANYNRIRHFATLQPGQPDPAGGSDTVTIFAAASNPVIVKTLDWVGTWQATPGLAASLGLEKSFYDFAPGTLSFARPNERVYLSLDADIGAWELTTKATWTGRQNLGRFYDYANTPRYNLDGSPKPDQSPAFTVVDVRGQYRLDKHWSAFVGVDNLFDYRQSRHDSFLWVDAAGGLDVTHIWGPNRGRYAYAGVTVRF